MKQQNRTDKYCAGCERTLPLDAFQKCSRRGVQARCRECRAAAAVEYRKRTKERRAAYNREYQKRNPERLKKYHAANRERRLRAMRGRYWSMTPEQRAAESRAAYERDIEKSRASRKRWAEENAERVKEYRLAYYQDNKQRWREYAEANREHLREQAARRRAEDPDKYRKWHQNRYARKQAQFVEEVHPLVLLERDDGRCGICGEDVDPMDFHIDHIIPLSRGGEHSYANTQVAHPFCNRSKNARLPEEMAA